MVVIFWVSEVVGKLYYVRSADENVGGSVGFGFLFLFQGFDKFLVVSYGGREARSWRARSIRVIDLCGYV